jgi:integrase/recombinase XerD
MDRLIESFLQDLQLRGMAKDTIRVYPSFIKAFQRWLDGKDLTEANRADFKSYIGFLRQEKGLKVKSIALHYTALASFYDYLIEEEIIQVNPLQGIRKRYLRQYKDEAHERRALSIQEAQRLISVILSTRDRAIVLMLLKTGMRLHELTDLDLADVDMDQGIIRLKPTPKRTNRVLFMDEELNRAIKRWLLQREKMNHKKEAALWLSNYKNRIDHTTVYWGFKKYAAVVGLDGISPHYCRHTFTTWLMQSGMPREYVQELRGDVGKEAIDDYNHISVDELKESYLAHMPRLGI